MRVIRGFLAITILALVIFVVIEQIDNSQEEVITDVTNVVKESSHVLQSKVQPEESPLIELEGDIFQWIGESENKLKEDLGEPNRVDKSAYGYEWLVYNGSESQYIQFGVEEEEIISVYATGDDLQIEPVQSGTTYEEVNDTFNFNNEISYNEGLSSYTFRLTEEDMKTRPLVKVDDSVFVQFYFDTFTSSLSSVRILTANTLLLHRPYEIEYRGNLPEQPELTDEQWNTVQKGMEQQVFDISNVIRHVHEKSHLEWDENVSEVAYEHSKDMHDNNYFSHISLNGDGLKERLEAGEVLYVSAGENIAAQYPDAASAMEGWLNSEGHREALLSDDYNHLGVGVYRFYYTQNFLGKAL
ncbi:MULTISPECIES: CAP domain-containing protein [Oceanobacillus]|uniref:Membrane protein YlbC n=1 Tax=Oceanobacillus kimchii TaxID=746691 RepID=A0ABQ5TIA1_9BACI|nr:MULTISPECIES: CAP domain-containing protein [Oceanobacillus]MBT2598822.1 CAP domain-containing protein [Oceanobacillus sp. ISL-74]MBT2651741.1 CAP domain-containing protein [Oceanobacillus sp. ISL-73]MCT1576390.1 CAP domain-containing protein [Oceanobacillus kimchii]MCT2136026.1 CAP domain-containing protein [Oceanobacillus kimchii]OEH54552.1 hypothetical protein AQ616_12395 [Oceanobacillus sp. E9]